MKKLVMAVMLAVGATAAFANTAVVDGITWTFTVSGGKAYLGDGGESSRAIPPSTSGKLVIPSQLGGCQVVGFNVQAFDGCSHITEVVIPEGVTSIGGYAFSSCWKLESVVIPSSVRSIGDCAFNGCKSLRSVVLPEGVQSLGELTFGNCSALEHVVLPSTLTSLIGRSMYDSFSGCTALKTVLFKGPPPSGMSSSALKSYCHLVFPREYGSEWLAAVGVGAFGGYCDSRAIQAEVLSSSIREDDPTVMDVVYKVTSSKPTVKVRVLAFEDGERSFAKVVRPETFIDETAVNVGDAVAPNVEHKISWKVSSDWQTKLAKVKFEVLASEGELLPLETMTIPASEQYGKMKISWNAIWDTQTFDALLWLYADKDPSLTLSNGVLKNGATQVASGTSISAVNAMTCLYSKMGYSLLTGAPLTYANQETRLGLSPSGARQYGYKIVE